MKIVPVLILVLIRTGKSARNMSSADAPSNNTELVQVFRSACPYTDLCLTPAADQIPPGKVPCCAPCSCQDYCHLLNNCCPDKQGPPTTMSQDDQSFLLTSDMFGCHADTSRTSSRYARQYKSYFMIDKCPSSWDGETFLDVQEKCTATNNNNNSNNSNNNNMADVLTYIPVSDRKTGLIYRNVYCAACHNVTGAVPWTTEVIFSASNVPAWTVTYPFPDDLAGMFHTEYGRVVFRPPFQENNAQCCFEDYAISRCNHAGYWRTFSSSVSEACESFSTPFFLMQYKNVFCSYCNAKTASRDYGCIGLEQTGVFTQFTAVLLLGKALPQEPKEERLSDGTSTETGCSAGFIFDTFQGLCRKQFCPMHQTMADGKCITFIRIRSILFHIMLKLELTDAFLRQETSETKLKAMQDCLEFVFGDRPDHYVFLSDVAETPMEFAGDPYLAVYLQVYAGDIQDEDIFEWFFKRINKKFVYENSQRERYIISLSLHDTLRAHTGNDSDTAYLSDMLYKTELISLYHDSQAGIVTTGIRITRLHFYKHVRLNMSEIIDYRDVIVVLASNRSLYGWQFQKVRIQHDQTIVHVCSDTYLHAETADDTSLNEHVTLTDGWWINTRIITVAVACGVAIAMIVAGFCYIRFKKATLGCFNGNAN